MTLWNFFTTRYTDHLEQENRELKSQLAMERQEVRRLTDALVPGLRRVDMSLRVPDPVGDTLKKTHHITKAADQQSASCPCGWKAESDNPIELQTAISEHYKISFPPVKVRRPSAAQQIQELEARSLEESKKQRT